MQLRKKSHQGKTCEKDTEQLIEQQTKLEELSVILSFKQLHAPHPARRIIASFLIPHKLKSMILLVPRSGQGPDGPSKGPNRTFFKVL